MIDLIANIGLTICGLTAVYLAASQDRKMRMWAGIMGLAGEPFWLTTAILNKQIGIVVLAFVYAYGWYRMIQSNRVDGD